MKTSIKKFIKKINGAYSVFPDVWEFKDNKIFLAPSVCHFFGCHAGDLGMANYISDNIPVLKKALKNFEYEDYVHPVNNMEHMLKDLYQGIYLEWFRHHLMSFEEFKTYVSVPIDINGEFPVKETLPVKEIIQGKNNQFQFKLIVNSDEISLEKAWKRYQVAFANSINKEIDEKAENQNTILKNWIILGLTNKETLNLTYQWKFTIIVSTYAFDGFGSNDDIEPESTVYDEDYLTCKYICSNPMEFEKIPDKEKLQLCGLDNKTINSLLNNNYYKDIDTEIDIDIYSADKEKTLWV